MHERGERHPWQIAPGPVVPWRPGGPAAPHLGIGFSGQGTAIDGPDQRGLEFRSRGASHDCQPFPRQAVLHIPHFHVSEAAVPARRRGFQGRQ